MSDYLNKVRELFPIGSKESGAELSVCTCSGNVGTDELVLHLVVWDDEQRFSSGETYRTIIDVKEQKIHLPDKAFETWDFWFALKDVLGEVLAQHPNIAGALPEDFFRPAWSALGLKSRDYHRALRMKSRLGKFLPRE